MSKNLSISSNDFWQLLKNNGYNFFSGVPCTIFQEALDCAFLMPDIKYIPAVRENVAIGIASGAYLAGRKSGIMIQNSGIGNIINALTSFNLIYKVPVLMFISWRGYKGKDAPEHLIMGKKMFELLRAMEIPTVVLSKDYKNELAWAIKQIEKKSVPVAVIIKEGIIK